MASSYRGKLVWLAVWVVVATADVSLSLAFVRVERFFGVLLARPVVSSFGSFLAVFPSEICDGEGMVMSSAKSRFWTVDLCA